MVPELPLLIGHFLRRELRSLRLELEAYPDEQLIWSLPPGLPNSAGTLALHLAGNLRHYVGALLGDSGYIRNRDEEFSARDIPRVVLLEQISEAEAAVESTLPLLTEEQMSLPFPEPIREHHLQTGELLLQLAVHLAYHLGQVSYHRRLVTGNVQGVGALSAEELVAARSILEPPGG
ncbi:MAG TPA: DinB family protein [Thermoanaerobaculia bacterium]|nr:DinB family protein [Thermoanaerobaculia bacterium]